MLSLRLSFKKYSNGEMAKAVTVILREVVYSYCVDKNRPFCSGTRAPVRSIALLRRKFPLSNSLGLWTFSRVAWWKVSEGEFSYDCSSSLDGITQFNCSSAKFTRPVNTASSEQCCELAFDFTQSCAEHLDFNDFNVKEYGCISTNKWQTAVQKSCLACFLLPKPALAKRRKLPSSTSVLVRS